MKSSNGCKATLTTTPHGQKNGQIQPKRKVEENGIFWASKILRTDLPKNYMDLPSFSELAGLLLHVWFCAFLQHGLCKGVVKVVLTDATCLPIIGRFLLPSSRVHRCLLSSPRHNATTKPRKKKECQEHVKKIILFLSVALPNALFAQMQNPSPEERSESQPQIA